jgi:hypothetical protein
MNDRAALPEERSRDVLCAHRPVWVPWPDQRQDDSTILS